MVRNFVVAVDNLTSEETKKINELFQGTYGWWHWIDGFWIVYDSLDRLSAASIRDQLGNVVGEKRRIVLEVTPGEWAGFGPNSEDSNMFPWMHKNWI